MSTPTVGSPTGENCKRCGAPTNWKKGRFGLFHGCTRYPGCRGRSGARRDRAVPAEGSTSSDPVLCSTVGCTKETGHTDDHGKDEPEIETDDDREEKAASEAPPEGLDPLGQILFKALAPAIEGRIASKLGDVTKVVREAREAFALALAEAKSGTSKIEWTVNGEVFAKIEGAHHKALPEVLRRVKAGIKNFLLVGPAGTGKTTLASDLAKAMGLEYGETAITAGMSEWQILGRSTPNLTTGENVYAQSPFVTLYEKGGVFCADEFDAADPNTAIVFNGALANGHMNVPSRTDKPRAERHPQFILIATANTYGNGASRQYVGRNQIDAATLSRFAGGVIAVDYDRDLEKGLIGDPGILARVWAIRERMTDLGIRQIFGTRELVAVTRLVKAGEYPLDQALGIVTTAWTPDERSKVGLH